MSRSRIIRLDNAQQFTAIQVLSDPGAIGGPLVVPNCWRIRLNFTLTDGKLAHCFLAGRTATSSDPTVPQAQAVFNALSTGGSWTAFAAYLAPTTGFAGVSLQNLHVANKPFVDSTGSSVPGTSAGTALPDETAVAVTLRTALTGQSGRGRVFIPGWSTTALGVGNVVLAAAVTALNAWAQTFSTAASNNQMTLALALPARQAYTGSTGTSHPARAAHTEVVTSITVRDNHWDTQRRRGLR